MEESVNITTLITTSVCFLTEYVLQPACSSTLVTALDTIIVERYTFRWLQWFQSTINLELSPVDHSVWKRPWRMAADSEWCSNTWLMNYWIQR